MSKDASAQGTARKPYPADKARGGEIILRTPLQQRVFMTGLTGEALLVLALALFAGLHDAAENNHEVFAHSPL